MKLKSTEQFNRECAQDLANDFGKPVDIYLHKGMWHSIQQGLRPVPDDAKHFETIYPQ